MKYRIRTTIFGNWYDKQTETVVYVPQYKRLLFWHDFEDLELRRTVYFENLEDAKHFLENRKNILAKINIIYEV